MAIKSPTHGHLDFVMVPREDFDRWFSRDAKAAFPPLPPADADGNYPAIETSRALLARKIIRDRLAVGYTQAELARRAKISLETMRKVESGKHSAAIATIDRIDRVLTKAEAELAKD